MSDSIRGIHHVTAIASDPQANLDFYAGLLGLRLVKTTVNFDDPGTYHFYFGDRTGGPGTILTFFPWPMARRGSRGTGQTTVTSFAVPERSLGFWSERLEAHSVVAEEPRHRFDEEALAFYDPDGLKLELVAAEEELPVEPWSGGPVPAEHAIRGFHGVTLALRSLEPTTRLLVETMGLSQGPEGGGRLRLEADRTVPGHHVDLLHLPDTGFGRIAAGSVHHVAWRVADATAQAVWRERLVEAGEQPTPVLDRRYFESIYFREPGGVLFEFATDGPGFTRDEPVESLGEALQLPPWLESERSRIEEALPTIDRGRSGSE